LRGPVTLKRSWEEENRERSVDNLIKLVIKSRQASFIWRTPNQ